MEETQGLEGNESVDAMTPAGSAGVSPASPEIQTDHTEMEQLKTDLAEARARALANHRRALLAENAGAVIPELVTGDTAEALDASVELARAAYDRVRTATAAEMAASAPITAGNGVRTTAIDVETMSPIQKIAYGLKRD